MREAEPAAGTRGAAGCPICARLAADQEMCQRCGWTLRTPWRPGTVTTKARTEFEARLAAARRGYDLRIVARIAADPAAWLDLIRGGPPTPLEWENARHDAAQDLADAADERVLCDRLGALLTALKPDEAATVTEVGPDGISVIRLRADKHGTPVAGQDGTTIAWSSLLPGLPEMSSERHFVLAAGTGGDPLPALAGQVAAAREGIVVCRPAGWGVLEQAAQSLASGPDTLLRAIAGPDSGPLLALLAELAACAPLTRDYRLLVADIDGESGTVTTRTRLLFPVGDLPGAQSLLRLRRLPGGGPETALAVFADDAVGTGDEPMALYSAKLPAGRSFRLRVALDGPGRVRIIRPAVREKLPRSWRRVRAAMPARVDVTSTPIDLVCAIDMAAETEEKADLRRRLVGGLIEQLAGEYEEPGEYEEQGCLRVAVLTCRDHHYAPGRERDRVVQATGFLPAHEAAAWLAAQPGQRIRYPDAAPIEDLLEFASRLLADSRPGGRAARLLTVAGRCPHPRRQEQYSPDHTLPCPFRYSWRECLRRLTRDARARCVTVTDALRDPVTAPATWRDLSPHGLHALTATTPRLLGEDLGLLVRPAQRIPIPLSGLRGGTP